MHSDIIRLPNGKTVTTTRARANGWVDASGNLTDLAPGASDAERAKRDAAREAEWRKSQGLDEPAPAAPKRRGRPPKAVPAADVDITADGIVKETKKIEPLRPRNVDHDGNPVEDPEVLAKIAEETAAIEAAAKAAREAAEAAGDAGA